MERIRESQIEITDFRCTRATNLDVRVVFGQTGREYTFAWQDKELALARPMIVGDCGLHSPEIVDCLARAIAHQASQRMPASLRASTWMTRGSRRPSTGEKMKKRDLLSAAAPTARTS